MQKKTIIFISIILVAVLGLIFYIKGVPSLLVGPSEESYKPTVLSEDETKELLKKLSGGMEVTETVSEREELLKMLASSSPGQSSSGGASTGPSDEERMKILELLKK